MRCEILVKGHSVRVWEPDSVKEVEIARNLVKMLRDRYGLDVNLVCS